jgi:methionine synthase I (cobalamin-dependent)
MGNSIEQAIEGLASAGADLVGSNCGNGARNMTLVAEQFVRHTDLPVVIRPNAGLPELRGGLPVYPESPAFMALEGRAMLALGVKVLGGCCGTTPGHISALRAIVEETAPAP